MCNLVNKYNVAGSRYTSYPAVPYWNIESGFVTNPIDWKYSSASLDTIFIWSLTIRI
ncbi:MAG: hypothetical protein AB8B65_04990 [Kordia sp.]|uniref:hypothetical protein n=1 Tax=Kordia sp. TaxID=1965332 RepID=UPI00385B1E23